VPLLNASHARLTFIQVTFVTITLVASNVEITTSPPNAQNHLPFPQNAHYAQDHIQPPTRAVPCTKILSKT